MQQNGVCPCYVIAYYNSGILVHLSLSISMWWEVRGVVNSVSYCVEADDVVW